MRPPTVSSTLHTASVAAAETALPLRPEPPAWLADLMKQAELQDVGSDVQALVAGPLAFLSAVVPEAVAMDAGTLRREVTHAYASMGDALRTTGTIAVRWWNYLPDPGAPMESGLDRYMVFNSGRHDGLRRWTATNVFEETLATASAVGAVSDDLVIHCLASAMGGRSIENPRQKPAWSYSARYGPLPPSFSRASLTSLNGRSLLLIGGTASIVGEDSMHRGDIQAQLEESVRNLAAVIGVALPAPEPASQAIERLVDVRAYVLRPQDAAAVRQVLQERCARAARIEVATSILCRPELLVEIEGVAELVPLRSLAPGQLSAMPGE